MRSRTSERHEQRADRLPTQSLIWDENRQLARTQGEVFAPRNPNCPSLVLRLVEQISNLRAISLLHDQAGRACDDQVGPPSDLAVNLPFAPRQTIRCLPGAAATSAAAASPNGHKTAHRFQCHLGLRPFRFAHTASPVAKTSSPRTLVGPFERLDSAQTANRSSASSQSRNHPVSRPPRQRK